MPRRTQMQRVFDPATFTGALTISLLTGLLLRVLFPLPPAPPTTGKR